MDTTLGSMLTIAGAGSVGVCLLLFSVTCILFLTGRAAPRKRSFADPAQSGAHPESPAPRLPARRNRGWLLLLPIGLLVIPASYLAKSLLPPGVPWLGFGVVLIALMGVLIL